MANTAELTLTEFLLARIAEQEADVRQRETYAVGHTECCVFEGGYEGTGGCDCGAVARVLAECAAKRQIVGLHPSVGGECGTCFDPAAWPCPTLRALASIYADHPACRAEWRN